ncbi:unnamed protein product [Dicrocoelium dendriticum]|nr:unnamed protein product [Dicrocoelium dendriticum]
MDYDYLNWPTSNRKRLSIAMACDFFYPNVGGVETHIFSLAQCLIRRGHRVTVITHSYGEKGKQRQGVRYMSRGLKVYYIPFITFYKQIIFLSLLGTLSIVRDILIREQVELVHGHSSFSLLSHETVIHAQSLGIHTVVTDHSLFGFADLSSVTMNKIVEGVLSAVDYVICVSHICKENSVLRNQLDPERVYVIPNALDTTVFTPDPSCRDMRYGGDGPKRLDLEEIRERHQLHARVTLLGGLSPEEVRGVLIQGDIFLNTSLTEAFCIALLEAVSCGLLVISTGVGGVPEVLPPEYIRLAPARASDLASCLSEAIAEVLEQRRRSTSTVNASEKQTTGELTLSGTPSLEPGFEDDMTHRAWRMHYWVRDSYSWPQVAVRTEKVYYAALTRKPPTLSDRLKCLSKCGRVYGRALMLLAMLHWAFLQLLSWVRPVHIIDKVPYFAYPIEEDTGTSPLV